MTNSELIASVDRLVLDPVAGEESAAEIREARKAERAAEIKLLKRRFDGILVFVTGAANVAMQLSWPEVGYGVIESRVESGQVTKHPLKRFRTTIGYIGISLLGTHQQRLAYREAINAQHRQVRSTPQSPVRYNAFNRDLQLWVASCIYYGVRDGAIRMHGPMTREEEVVLLRACARLGTTLQVPPDMWHQSPEAFDAYWEEGLKRVRIDKPVADYLHALLRYELVPANLGRILGPSMLWVNTGFLPEPIRDELGLAWTEKDQRRHDRLLRSLGAVSRPLPHVIRAQPIRAMMWNLETRRRLGRPLT